jgi:hypothetical protein
LTSPRVEWSFFRPPSASLSRGWPRYFLVALSLKNQSDTYHTIHVTAAASDLCGQFVGETHREGKLGNEFEGSILIDESLFDLT